MTTTTPAGDRKTSGGPPALDVRALRKRFGDVAAVDDLTLHIEPGEVVALLGPNGAGKTSTVDMVLGLSDPTAGTIEVFGRAPGDAVADGRVAAVMQTGGLLRDFTVEETVRFTAELFGARDAVEAALARAGLQQVRGRLVGKCSGGEQQRLRFALALLPDPDLLILDEPTTGMDVGARHAFWTAIREDARQGRTVVFATHYLEEADAYADRIVVMRQGRIIADGTAGQIKSLAKGRSLRATAPGLELQALRSFPGVERVEQRGDAVVVSATDTDALARWLLTETGAHDLEITAHNLDEAFLALTSDVPRSDDPTGTDR